jgi:hypothetical protein
MEIINKKDIENLDKKFNISILSELENDKFLVRYSGQINDNIRKLYLKDPLLKENKKITHTKGELRKSGINKPKTIPSAIHIAAAISSYARIFINEYKNIPGNPCIMSDTDSAVLTKPLPEQLVGKGLGQIKLVNGISNGIFIRKKFYCIINSDNQEVIKASGIDSSKLSYNCFIKLLNGESIRIDRTNFNVD